MVKGMIHHCFICDKIYNPGTKVWDGYKVGGDYKYSMNITSGVYSIDCLRVLSGKYGFSLDDKHYKALDDILSDNNLMPCCEGEK
jgi:hypothetical protein